MDFERMFEDLEGRFDHLEAEDMRAVSDELTRAERAQIQLADRFRAAVGDSLVVQLSGGADVDGVLAEVGEGWLRLRAVEGSGGAVIPQSRIAMIEGLAARSRQAPPSRSSQPRGIGHMLRRLGRDRTLLRVHTESGAVHGRIRAVGADALDLRTAPSGEPGRVARGRDVTVPVAGIVVIQTF